MSAALFVAEMKNMFPEMDGKKPIMMDNGLRPADEMFSLLDVLVDEQDPTCLIIRVAGGDVRIANAEDWEVKRDWVIVRKGTMSTNVPYLHFPAPFCGRVYL
eukprot:TRINITY_DN1595_c0_g1_i1.p1 TRINITY_DN1595_c0_g1~~TRINITY_DN1595_c0_g1_i1.p1  ORF type:complete len:102 (+),score=22.97 TRINITY_DN1595_c0_g1_i1:87-392(+)